MKYAVGDKVRVREDLELDKEYGGYLFTSLMARFKGNVMTISEVYLDCYLVKGDKFYFFWTDEMLERAEGEEAVYPCDSCRKNCQFSENEFCKEWEEWTLSHKN